MIEGITSKIWDWDDIFMRFYHSLLVVNLRASGGAEWKVGWIEDFIFIVFFVNEISFNA